MTMAHEAEQFHFKNLQTTLKQMLEHELTQGLRSPQSNAVIYQHQTIRKCCR